jgi:hypothetical protein
MSNYLKMIFILMGSLLLGVPLSWSEDMQTDSSGGAGSDQEEVEKVAYKGCEQHWQNIMKNIDKPCALKSIKPYVDKENAQSSARTQEGKRP